MSNKNKKDRSLKIEIGEPVPDNVKKIYKIAFILMFIGGIVLICSTIFISIINMGFVKMPFKTQLLIDGICLGVVLVTFLIAYILYRVGKNKAEKEKENE